MTNQTADEDLAGRCLDCREFACICDGEDDWDGEGLEGDDDLSNCHAFVDGGVFVCGAVGSEDCDECIFHSDLGKTVSEVEEADE